MSRLQPYGVSCKGGLNTNLTQFEMLAKPGLAMILENFEVDTDGGYRRINGFTKFGGASQARPNSTNPIIGLQVYHDGVIASSGTNIYFSNDGITWLLINRSSVSASGDNYSTFTGRSVATRTNQGQCNFAIYDGDSTFGEVFIADESSQNNIFYFRIEGTGALSSRTYYAKEITVGDGSPKPTLVTVHDRHLVASGDSSSSNTIYVSGTDDPESFSSTGSFTVKTDDKIIGIKGFRQDLIIFGKNSLFKLVNINDTDNVAIQPITTNVGCLDNHTIQEIAGDLVFLAPDGVRTVAGTARIGDLELSSISRQIQKRIELVAADISNLTLSSVVLRQKSEYRIYYSKLGQTPRSSKGIIGTLTSEGFAWSETLGIQAHSVTSGFDSNNVEQTYHGDRDGYVYNHDVGNSFFHNNVEANIRAVYKTPHFDFGDFGTTKNLRYVKLAFTPEGQIQPTLRVRYDYESTTIPQPNDYILDSVPVPSLFGTSKFGQEVLFGSTTDPLVRVSTQGAGTSISFRILSDDKNAPYSINGIYAQYLPSQRR
jgi:hypothetical protein